MLYVFQLARCNKLSIFVHILFQLNILLSLISQANRASKEYINCGYTLLLDTLLLHVHNIKINKSKKCFYMAIVNFIVELPCFAALVVQFIWCSSVERASERAMNCPPLRVYGFAIVVATRMCRRISETLNGIHLIWNDPSGKLFSTICVNKKNLMSRKNCNRPFLMWLINYA